MKYAIGIAIVWSMSILLMSGAYLFLMLVNDLFVRLFDINPMKWLKRYVFEPIGDFLFGMICNKK